MSRPEQPSPLPAPSGLDEAVRLFNDRAFFEAHDLFEEEWASACGERREALKALVKIAAGMYHLQTSGFAGAENLLGGGLALLRELPEQAQLVVLPPVCEPAARCLAKIRAVRSGSMVEWQSRDLPRLELRSEPAPAAG